MRWYMHGKFLLWITVLVLLAACENKSPKSGSGKTENAAQATSEGVRIQAIATPRSPKPGSAARTSGNNQTTVLSTTETGKGRRVIAGEVRLNDGTPAAETTITVRVVKRWGQGATFENLPIAAQTTTDKAGNYRLEVSPETMGMGVIEAVKAGYGGVGNVLHQGMPEKRLTNFNFTLAPATKLEGQVVDSSGKPVGDAVVKSRPRYDTRDGRQANYASNHITTTSVDGRFQISAFSASNLEVLASAGGHGFLQKSCPAPASNQQLMLPSSGATISGRVTNKETGSAVASTQIDLLLHKGRNTDFSTMFLRPGLTAITDEQGNYRISSIPKGSYELGCNVPELYVYRSHPESSSPLRFDGQETSSGIDLELFTGYTLTGVARDKKTSAPISGVQISDYQGVVTSPSLVISDANGRFSVGGLMPHPESNITFLKVKHPEYVLVDNGRAVQTAYQVELPGKEIQFEKDFLMSQLVHVLGTIKTPEGMPITAARAKRITGANDPDENPNTASVTVDGSGNFKLPALPFSTMLVRAEADGFPDAYSKALSIADVDLTGTEIVMKPGARIRGSVVSPTGEPIAGATVVANWQVSDQIGDPTGKSPKQQVTDAKGTFNLELIPPRKITLSASAKAYLSSESVSLSLSPGETTSGIRLMLDDPHFVAGHVTNEEGKPLAGIQVTGVRPRSEQREVYTGFESYSDNGDQISTVTDTNGNYRLEGLRSGKVSVVAGSDEYFPETRETAVDLDKVDFKLRSRKLVTLSARVVDSKSGQPVQDLMARMSGEEYTVEQDPVDTSHFFVRNLKEGHVIQFELSAPGYTRQTVGEPISGGNELLEKTYKLHQASSIAGRAIDKATKAPIAGVMVKIGGTRNSQYAADSGEAREARTDAGGQFRITGAGNGNVTVRFEPPAPYVNFFRDAVCEAGGVSDMGDILLDTGGSITGKVVRAPGDVPVKGITVNLSGRSTTSDNRTVQKTAVTDADGKFQFTALSNMGFSLSIAESEASTYVMIESSDHKTVTLRIGSATLNGTLLRAGKPETGYLQLSMGAYADRTSRNVQIDESGKFTLTNISPGKWNVIIRNSQNAELNETVDIPESGIVEKTFVMPSATIVGIVLDEKGAPVANATVSAKGGPDANQAWSNVLPSNYDRGASATSKADGRFALANVPPGKYTIKGTLDGIGSASVEGVQVPIEGETAQVTLKLKPTPTGTLVSTALNMSSGGPIKEAWCMLWSGKDKYEHSSTRNDEGVMTVEKIPEGDYKVQVSSFGFAVSERMIKIEAGKTLKIEDVLYDAGAVRFSVQDKNGSAVPDAICTLTPDDPKSIEQPRNGTTDRTGLWVVRGLFPGTYSATANASGHNPGKGSVTVQAHQPIDLLIRLE